MNKRIKINGKLYEAVEESNEDIEKSARNIIGWIDNFLREYEETFSSDPIMSYDNRLLKDLDEITDDLDDLAAELADNYCHGTRPSHMRY